MLQTAGERIAPDKNPHHLQLDGASVKEIRQNEEKKKGGTGGYINSLPIQALPSKHVICL